MGFNPPKVDLSTLESAVSRRGSGLISAACLKRTPATMARGFKKKQCSGGHRGDEPGGREPDVGIREATPDATDMHAAIVDREDGAVVVGERFAAAAAFVL